MRYTNQVVLITGALGGLGRTLVQRFLAEGAHVLACFRGEISRAHSLIDSLPEAEKKCCFPYSFDLNDAVDVEQSIRSILATHSHVDLLINNGGVNEEAPFMTLSDEQFEVIIATNLTAVRRISALLSRSMMARRSGSIITISSTLGSIGGRGSASYASAKAGVNRLTECMAVELGRKGIRVNAVAPGLLDCGMRIGMHPEAVEASLERTPLRRLGTAHEVADAVLFLGSSQASFITGHILTVDGGMTCG